MNSNFNRKALEAIQGKRLDLAERKNNDYSGAVDNIGVTGVPGLAVRLFDKASRLLSLTQAGAEQKVLDESIRDTLLDMGNYADFGVSLLDKTWNNESVIGEEVEALNA